MAGGIAVGAAQVSEDAVPILQVALVGASLPHGEGAGSTRERRRAARDWPQPHCCSTTGEHHGDFCSLPEGTQEERTPLSFLSDCQYFRVINKISLNVETE